MVSRRKILSQSRDELSYVQEEEEDVWYTRDKLYKVVRKCWRWNLQIFGVYWATSDRVQTAQ